jgi:M6 family metalloprotease-like protein
MRTSIAPIAMSFGAALFFLAAYQLFAPTVPDPSLQFAASVGCSTVHLTDLSQNTSPASLANDLGAATQKVSELYISQSRSEQVFSRDKMYQALANRKTLFVQAMYANPQAAMAFVLLSIEQDYMHRRFPNCAEQSTVLQGQLQVTHFDNRNGSSQTTYALQTADGRVIALHPTVDFSSRVESRETVNIKGFLINNELLFDPTQAANDTHASGLEVITTPGNPPVTGVQNVLVILANFQNTPQPTVTNATINDVLFTQVNNFYKEVSYGKISIEGTIAGWFTLPLNQTCDQLSTIAAALNAAAPNVNYNLYNRVMVVAPFSSCTWDGWADLGTMGNRIGNQTYYFSRSTIDANIGVNPFVMGHELGHNFGMAHTSIYNCGTTAGGLTADYSGCTYNEYGPADIMGSAVGHFTAHHMNYAGWFNNGNLQKVAANGTFVLSPIETNDATLKAIYLPRSSNENLWAEYRQPIGFDIGETGTQNGALLSVDQGSLFHSYLFTPGGSDQFVALMNGVTFKDPLTGSTITNISQTPAALTLQVTLGKSDFTLPTVSVTSPVQNQQVSGMMTITVAASAASGIEKVEFYKGADTTPFATSTVGPSYTATFDTTTAPNGQLNINIKAYDNSGVPFGVRGNINTAGVGVLVNNAGGAGPSITLTAPAGGPTAYQSPVQFSAIASDSAGISRVDFYVDIPGGQPWATVNTPPYNALITLSPGNHTAYAKAYDTAGLNALTPGKVFMVGSGGGPTPTPTPLPTPTPTPTPTPIAIPTPTPTPMPMPSISQIPNPTPPPPIGCQEPAYSPWPAGWAHPCPNVSLSASIVTPLSTSLLTLSAAPSANTSAAYVFRTFYLYDMVWNCPGKVGGAWCPLTLQGTPDPSGPSYLLKNTGGSFVMNGAFLQNLTIGTHYLASWDWTWNATAGAAGCYQGPDGLCSTNSTAYRLQSFNVQLAM